MQTHSRTWPLVAALRCLVSVAAVAVAGCDQPTSPPIVEVPGTTTVNIDVTGVSAAVPVNITLSGPGGATRTLTSSGPVSGVAAGVWTATAAPTPGAFPVLPVQSVTVAAGQTATLRVRYSTIPVSGSAESSLVGFDDTMLEFMGPRRIPAGEIEIVRNGRTVLSRAYGWKDQARSVPLPPGTPMRIASLTKAVTMSAIRQLVAAGTISYSTAVYPYLGLATLPAGALEDPRVNAITVQHLLDHRGGWIAPGSIPNSRMISQTLGLNGPPTRAQVAQFMKGQALDANPGATESYSNFGYLLLGLVVEKAAGQDFLSFVRLNMFGSASADVWLAASPLGARDPREPWYSDPFTGCSVFIIASCSAVPYPEGGFHYEGFVSYGGLVVTPTAYLTFMSRFWGNGTQRAPGASGNWIWLGSINGTFTMARWYADGTNVVAFFNQRSDASGLNYDDFWKTIDATVAAIGSWP